MSTGALSHASVEKLIAATLFDGSGLVPVIAQDRASGGVRMLAWASAEALRATAKTGRATFWSRSRGELWEKGQTSGNGLRVREIRLDCDGDAILYCVDAEGPSCHEGPTSCFFRQADEAGAWKEDDGPAQIPSAILSKVAATIAARRTEAPETSYVASLLKKGFPKILEKIAEECGELAEALPLADRTHTTHEAADLIFHVMVGLEAAGIPIDDLFAELQRRFGTSGHTEKAARMAGPSEEPSEETSVAPSVKHSDKLPE